MGGNRFPCAVFLSLKWLERIGVRAAATQFNIQTLSHSNLGFSILPEATCGLEEPRIDLPIFQLVDELLSWATAAH